MSSNGRITRAYSYLRFSTPRQMRGDSYRRQIELARQYAVSHGLVLQDTTIADLGVSAFKGANRDAALGHFLDMVKSGEVPQGSYLLVESHDRLSRQHVERALSQFLEVVNAGVVIATLSDGQVYRAGQLDMLKLITSLVYMSRANEESEMKSRRATAAWEYQRQKAKEGAKIRNSALPGWLAWKGNDIVLKEREVEVIRLMFDKALDGAGYEQIAAFLNSNGIPTFRKHSQWRPAGVSALLKSRALIGEYKPHQRVDGVRKPIGEPIHDYYPAVIELADFLEVQRLISTRNNHSGSYRKGLFRYLFSGLIRCQCGELLRHHNKGSKESPRHYLVCPMKTAGQCDMPFLRYDHFEPQVLVAISHLPALFQRQHGNQVAVQRVIQQIAETQELHRQLSEKEDNALRLLINYPTNEKLNRQFALISEEAAACKQRVEGLEAERDRLLQSERTITLLTTDNLSTTESRQQFNSRLKQTLSSIKLIMENGTIALSFYASNHILLCEQVFNTEWKPRRGVELRGSHVMELDGTTVCRTTREPPYIDDSWIEGALLGELPSYPEIEEEGVFNWETGEGRITQASGGESNK
ncbi:recombinase family protein [Ferrimonas sp. SCSIO 43195]|uniref:recombinase family protein n=1 Tax=Ferrimonas sp. SCSIO 43195 TaxID=2822844 RepID=UPI002075D97C|nr:recombinase family protein [Ferrimonas sp. SCSIO 43195]USD35992.1 recombinase family protein [Ferrimonas sp. SCSIO 43195]